MMNTARALYSFFSGFGLKAYVEGYVPDDATLPYITYELSRPDRMHQMALRARIWYYDTSFEGITATADSIKETLGDGLSIPTSDGAMRIWPDDFFMQFQATDEPDLKVAYLSMVLETDYS